MVHRFCSKFSALSSNAKNFVNWLRFDKVTESLKVGTFLRHSVYTKLFSILSRLRLVYCMSLYLNIVCFSWSVCEISINCEFKMICMQKMNIIVKISCYYSAVLLH